MMESINACFESAGPYRLIATYSHLLPVGVLGSMAIFIVTKSLKSLNTSFFFFVFFLSMWLVGDWVTWNSDNYYMVNTAWSMLDLLDIMLYISAVYFYYVFLTGNDIGFRTKAIVFSIIAWPIYINLTGQSIGEFNHAQCEALENGWFTTYRFFTEIASVAMILFLSIYEWRKKQVVVDKKSFLIVTVSMIGFLVTFSLSGLISSLTFIYEVQLYGMFTLPIFIGFMVFAINRYDVFDLKSFNIQLLSWTLVALVGSEYFFLNSRTESTLNTVTLMATVLIVISLGRSINKENRNRKKIEDLNKNLTISNKALADSIAQKNEFISIASHQIRGPLTSIKGYASMILEGDVGKVEGLLRDGIETMFKSAQSLVVLVGDYLDISRMDQGKMKYDFSDFDLVEIARQVVKEMQPNVKISRLTLDLDAENEVDYFIHGDQGKIKQVMSNLVDNSVKYTSIGGITIILRREKDKIFIKIKDTGIGIEAAVIPKLFERFTRAPDAGQTNMLGTGLGLYVARKMVEAHRGRIWAESEGKHKGTVITIELDAIHKTPTELNKKIEAKILEVDKQIESHL
jgi:signal transduction histidine kinase